MANQFYTPSLLITDYYDSLIREIDIYTEELFKLNEEFPLGEYVFLGMGCMDFYFPFEFETYGVKAIKNPYKREKYNPINSIDSSNLSKEMNPLGIEYLNRVRTNAIEEIRKAQEYNLNFYKENKERFKEVDRENLTEEKLEELKSNLFAEKFCFLVNSKKSPHCKYNNEILKDCYFYTQHTVITDFYLRDSDIDYIRKRLDSDYKIEHNLTRFDQSFLLANRVKSYIKEATNKRDFGYEVIPINKKTLLDIRNMAICHYNLCYDSFKKTDLRFTIDLSAIKSLYLNTNNARIDDLSAFSNIEYLSFCRAKLCGRPFQHLHKLINIKIVVCDLNEFDFDSLNSVTSLQFIEINRIIHIEPTALFSLKLDLSRLVNLKWIELSLWKEIDFELITNYPSTQLTVFKFHYKNYNAKTNECLKPFDLPELKRLDIRYIDLSLHLSQQWFNGLSSLIKLRLDFTKLTNVDFLDTDRLQNLERLDLAHNNIEVLKKGSFSKLKKLKQLDLSYNQFSELVPGTFTGLDRLERLVLSSRYLNLNLVDKSVFDELKSLRTFDK